MCSLDDTLNLPVSLRPRLVTWVVVLALQERVAHVLASLEDKGCAVLLLPSCAITVHSVPTCFNQYGIYVHVAKHMKVREMEETDESIVWRDVIGLSRSKRFLRLMETCLILKSRERTS